MLAWVGGWHDDDILGKGLQWNGNGKKYSGKDEWMNEGSEIRILKGSWIKIYYSKLEISRENLKFSIFSQQCAQKTVGNLKNWKENYCGYETFN